jgi:TetR/AcrR family transcriptional regulator, tetracycline repressor protein
MAAPQNPRRRSRDDISATALRLLDEYGLPDLTMRHLATALGVQPSALYWHFPSKQALLAAVSERILAPMAEVAVDGLSVRESVLVLGERMRNCLLAYRDASELVSSSLALGLVPSPLAPQLRAVARQHGLDDALAEVAAAATLHFVVGFAFHEQQRVTADALGLLDPAALSPDAVSARPAAADDFAEALTMIADGVEASIARHARPLG